MITATTRQLPRRAETRRRRRLHALCQALIAVMALACLAACHTSRRGTSAETAKESSCLSAKVRLRVPSGQAVLTVNGTMKMKGGELLQMSFLMPVLRTEVARIEVTPDEVLLVDRMGKRYVRATRSELKGVLPAKADFAHLEKLVRSAAKPGEKTTITGKDLGLKTLEKGEIDFSDFSYKEVSITPTQLSPKYKQVEWHELLEMLMSL